MFSASTARNYFLVAVGGGVAIKNALVIMNLNFPSVNIVKVELAMEKSISIKHLQCARIWDAITIFPVAKLITSTLSNIRCVTVGAVSHTLMSKYLCVIKNLSNVGFVIFDLQLKQIGSITTKMKGI